MKVVLVTFLLCITYVGVISYQPWNELVFTQSWPASFCTQIKIQGKHTCKIPANVTTWNIHGIWPTQGGGFGPNYCNKTQKFNSSAIAPIRDQLLKYWANLFEDEKPEDFWTHEWTKHGTCAEELDSLGTELKYFSAGLWLNKKIDLLKFFSQAGIVPSDSTEYNLDDMVNAMESQLGITPKLYCFLDKTKTHQYISQIEVCLNKQFEVIQCLKKGKSNSEDNTLRFKPQSRSSKRLFTPAQNEPCNNRLRITYPSLN